MEKFFSEHPEVAVMIIALLVTIVGFFLRWLIKRISSNETEIKEVKENYLDRFDDLKETINTNHLDLSNNLSSINQSLIDQKSFCQFIQDGKKK